MPHAPLRETVFDAGCLLAGRMARLFGHRLRRPAIIIGTGRCGTSLLVQMLKSHADLAGFPGEANELWHPALEPFEKTKLGTPPIEVDPGQFSKVSLTHWPRSHGERIRDVFAGYHFMKGSPTTFVTKSAMLSFMVPTLLELFPDARIIHIYRFGPSVVESYFQKNFGKYSRFSFSEGEYRSICARYWNSCILEIAEKTRALSGDQFLEFSYEALCRDPRDILNTLARFLGVPANGFEFDVSTVSDQNFKTRNARAQPESEELLTPMLPGLMLKGYAL